MDSNLFLVGFALLIGASAALVGWVISRALADVPAENREYKDPPPLGFRFVWWPIQWVNHYLSRLMPESRQLKLALRLRKAGLDYSLSPSQYVSSRVICGLMAGALGWWIVGSFDGGASGRNASGGLNPMVYWEAALAAGMMGWIYPAIWLRDRLMYRRRELLKAFPFYLDIITLCVEAGLNLQGAIHQAVAKGPKGVMRDELQRILRDVRAGKPRAESFRAMAERLNEPSISSFVIAVIQAESMGMNMGPVLRAQADQRRTERFLRAEKLAMEAPVKMLFPLIAFIFPCTFIVLFFPIVMMFMKSGM